MAVACLAFDAIPEHIRQMKQHSACYLCQSNNFIQKPGSVRDMPELDILECTEWGLIFFSSFLHIHDAFYQQSGMHYNELDLAHWQRNTKHDDVRRFHALKPLLTNRSLFDFGCGTGGFLKKVQKLTD